ncbi:hypothetical protein PENTCL1PPCAC_4945, partial [Pristionchus entomophagus]
SLLNLKWVTHKSSYLFVSDESAIFVIGGVVIFLCYFCLTILTVIIMGQMLVELKHGMIQRSTATKRYQKRAVVALVFKGNVPNMIYVVPSFALGCLYVFTMLMGLKKSTGNQTISIASALIFNIVFTHTVAHSITVLAFSPTYRRTIQRVLRFPGSSTTPRQSIPFLHSISKPFDR